MTLQEHEDFPIAIMKLNKDLASAARTLDAKEARFLVDAYYIIQEDRKRSGNQQKALDKSDEPHEVIDWFLAQNRTLENQIKNVLHRYADASPIGQWAMSITAVGPVIAAGLLANIDVSDPNTTVGQKWRFAGMDPTSVWRKGEKRPWNDGLKTLMYKAGECFVKFQNHEDDFYGKMFVARKAKEVERNRTGDLAEQAARRAGELRVLRKTESESFKWYSARYPAEIWDGYLALSVDERDKRHRRFIDEPGSGLPMLPPAHIHSRARRWTAKMFLSHYVDVAYQHEHGRPLPAPWVIAKFAEHTHFVMPPNVPAWYVAPEV